MTLDDGNLLSKSIYFGNALVNICNGTLLPVANIGNSSLPSKMRPLTLKNVLHVPKIQHNLLLVRQLCQDNNCTVVFYLSSIRAKDYLSLIHI